MVGRRALFADFPKHLAVVMDISYDSLPIVLGNVLGLIARLNLTSLSTFKKPYFFVYNLRDFY